METIGIIAEYNPFHNGHLYHLNKIKELYPNDTIVLIINGNFTERGTTSLIDKWKKVEIAKKAGIDLIIELPYPLDALEPYYNAETLNIHYNILYKGYVENYNNVQEELRKAREENNFKNIKCLEKNLSFQGSGVILHELFFTNMRPQSRNSIGESLYSQIIKDFGSFDAFKKQFNEASKQVEASRMGIVSMGAKI